MGNSPYSSHLHYLLHALTDEMEGAGPDEMGPGPGVGVEPAQGADPYGAEPTDASLGVEPAQYDNSPMQDFTTSPLDSFLERFSAGGVPGGLRHPHGFLQGLVSGAAAGAVGAGQQVAERRRKFEAAQLVRQAQRDRANIEATQRHQDQRGSALRSRVNDQRNYERDNVVPTAQQLADNPSLGRALDAQGRVPRDWLKPEKPQSVYDAAMGKMTPEQRIAYETRLANGKKAGDTSGDESKRNAVEVARGIADGTLSPNIVGNRGSKDAMQVYSELHKMGVDLTTRQIEYTGLMKFYQNQNSPHMIQLRNNGATALGALDKLQTLNDALDKVIKRSHMTFANEGELKTALNSGVLGKHAARLAQQVQAQTGDAVLYLQGVYSGGYAPNDGQLAQAIKNLNAYWAPDVQRGAIELGKSNVHQRLNAANEAQAFVPPGAPTYPGVQPTQGGGPQNVIRVVRDPVTGKLVRAAGGQ